MEFSVAYPRILEDWWINVALEQLACNSLREREHQLEQSIQILSDRFTKERFDLAEDYFNDPSLLCAYGLFFFPQSYVRTQFVLQEILSRGWTPPKPVSVLDLGSGAGAASFSAASLLTGARITAIDRSRPALAMMKRIATECSSLWPQLDCEVHMDDLWHWIKRENRKWDLILASFALNESRFSIEKATAILAKRLTEHGIIIVMEPALRSTSEGLETWRDYIVERTDLHIWGPCLHQSLCPLLKEGKFWCHEVRSWRPPVSLSFLNRHLYRQIHVLKFSFLVFGKTAPQPIASFSFRLISPVAKKKKKLLFTGCTTEGTKKEFQMKHPLTNESKIRSVNGNGVIS